MKRLGTIAVCLAGGLALNAGLRADELALANNPSLANPYSVIAVRNIFGLNPPAPPPDPAADEEKNLPKITLTGIQYYFGELQALFKVSPAKGQAKVEYYTLNQGQRQDDIEVVHIDQEKGVVAFNNHGFPQEFPLTEASPSGGAAASSPSGGTMNTAAARGGFGGGNGSSAGGFTRFGAETGANNGGNPNSNPGSNGGNPNDVNGGLNFANSSTQNRGYQPEAPTMTPEQTVIWIEAQRAQAQQEKNPIANILPPTPLTKFNTPNGEPPTP